MSQLRSLLLNKNIRRVAVFFAFLFFFAVTPKAAFAQACTSSSYPNATGTCSASNGSCTGAGVSVGQGSCSTSQQCCMKTADVSPKTCTQACTLDGGCLCPAGCAQSAVGKNQTCGVQGTVSNEDPQVCSDVCQKAEGVTCFCPAGCTKVSVTRGYSCGALKPTAPNPTDCNTTCQNERNNCTCPSTCAHLTVPYGQTCGGDKPIQDPTSDSDAINPQTCNDPCSSKSGKQTTCTCPANCNYAYVTGTGTCGGDKSAGQISCNSHGGICTSSRSCKTDAGDTVTGDVCGLGSVCCVVGTPPAASQGEVDCNTHGGTCVSSRSCKTATGDTVTGDVCGLGSLCCVPAGAGNNPGRGGTGTGSPNNPSQTDPGSGGTDPASGESVFGVIQPPTGTEQFSPNGGNGLLNFISMLIRIFTVVSGIIVFFNFLISGYTYVTSDGNSKATETVRNRLTYSILGLVLIVSSYTIIALISLILFGNASYILNPTIGPVVPTGNTPTQTTIDPSKIVLPKTKSL